jgi:hypothetical protein
MKFDEWKNVAELVGLAAIVASLIFVGVQMKQDRAIATAEGNLANAANRIESNNAILEHPDIWVRGNSGEELGEKDAVVFNYMVQNAYDVAFFETVRLDRLGYYQISEKVTADFSVFLFRNPGARRLWTEQIAEQAKYRALIVEDQDVFYPITQAIRENLVTLDKVRN